MSLSPCAIFPVFNCFRIYLGRNLPAVIYILRKTVLGVARYLSSDPLESGPSRQLLQSISILNPSSWVTLPPPNIQ